jgi:hypothetical protein
MQKVDLTNRQRRTFVRLQKSHGALAVMADGRTVVDVLQIAAGAPPAIWRADNRMAAHLAAQGTPVQRETQRLRNFLSTTLAAANNVLDEVLARLPQTLRMRLQAFADGFEYEMRLGEMTTYLRSLLRDSLTGRQVIRLRDAILNRVDCLVLQNTEWTMYDFDGGTLPSAH